MDTLQVVLLPQKLNGSENQPWRSAVFEFQAAKLLAALTVCADSDEEVHGSGRYVDACRRLIRQVAAFRNSEGTTFTLTGPDCYVFEEYLMATLLREGAFRVECGECSRAYASDEVSVTGSFPAILRCPAGHGLFRTADYIR